MSPNQPDPSGLIFDVDGKKMKQRMLYGTVVGLIAGFLGLWGFQIQTLPGSVAFVSVFAVALAIIFALASEKTTERIVAFFTYFWP